MRSLLHEEGCDAWHDVWLSRHTSPHQKYVRRDFIHISGTNISITDRVHRDDGPVARSHVPLDYRWLLKTNFSNPIISRFDLETDGSNTPDAADEMQEEHHPNQVIEQTGESRVKLQLGRDEFEDFWGADHSQDLHYDDNTVNSHRFYQVHKLKVLAA